MQDRCCGTGVNSVSVQIVAVAFQPGGLKESHCEGVGQVRPFLANSIANRRQST
jgi:hypothetical protein